MSTKASKLQFNFERDIKLHESFSKKPNLPELKGAADKPYMVEKDWGNSTIT